MGDDLPIVKPAKEDWEVALYKSYFKRRITLSKFNFAQNLSDSECDDSKLPIPCKNVFGKKEPMQFIMGIVKSGELFGDCGLEEGSRRLTSVYAKKDTHLLCIAKFDFDRIHSLVKERLIAEKNNFLKANPVLSQLSQA